MKVSNYLKQRLEKCSQYILSPEDEKQINKKGIETYIFSKLVSKKFRKWSLDEDSAKAIKRAISLNVKKNKPILFTFPFGGYKLHQLPSSPAVDWAEFFMIAYYSEWIAPISQAYKPGAIFYFSSDDVIVGRMDNIPVADTKAYFNSFEKLLTHFNKYNPKNTKFEIKRVGDLYTKEEFEKELEPYIEEVKEAYKNPDPIRYKKMIKTSRLNIQWDGTKDWTNLSEKEKDQIVKMGPIYHDAYGKLTKRRDFVRGEDKIVTFSTPIPNAIALGTTKNSITKFWTGFGVLEKEDDKFFDRILSPEQLKLAKSDYKEEKVNIVDLKNFESIRVYSKRFHFSR